MLLSPNSSETRITICGSIMKGWTCRCSTTMRNFLPRKSRNPTFIRTAMGIVDLHRWRIVETNLIAQTITWWSMMRKGATKAVFPTMTMKIRVWGAEVETLLQGTEMAIRTQILLIITTQWGKVFLKKCFHYYTKLKSWRTNSALQGSQMVPGRTTLQPIRTRGILWKIKNPCLRPIWSTQGLILLQIVMLIKPAIAKILTTPIILQSRSIGSS